MIAYERAVVGVVVSEKQVFKEPGEVPGESQRRFGRWPCRPGEVWVATRS
jgi:hypothetical protein